MSDRHYVSATRRHCGPYAVIDRERQELAHYQGQEPHELEYVVALCAEKSDARYIVEALIAYEADVSLREQLATAQRRISAFVAAATRREKRGR